MVMSDTDFETKITLEAEAFAIDDEPPFHVLLFGNWSGSHPLAPSASGLHPIEIDRDNFNDVMRKLDVRVDLEFPENSSETILSLRFTELDDFHPDKIFERLSLFSDLRSLRQRLIKADTFDAAAREVRSWLIEDEYSEVERTENEKVSLEEEIRPVPDDLLEQIFNKRDAEVSTTETTNTEFPALGEFIGKLVKPHIVQTDTAEQSKLLMIVDEVTADLMRKILHHPQFQAIESAWRSLYLLVRRIETDSFLKLFLYDISKDELSAELKSASNLSDSIIYRNLIAEAVDPWAMFCGNYTFELNIDDVSTLIRIARLGSVSNIPFVSHVNPETFGFNSILPTDENESWQITENSPEGKLWATLRSMPESRQLGLVLPKFLARLPYGSQTDPAENFYFEEFAKFPEHKQYLWANPVFICVLLATQSFSRHGWNLLSNFALDVDGLSMHQYKENGQAKTKPCAEFLISENICEKLLKQGLMPLITFRDTDRIRLARLQSIAYPLSPLSGRWDSFDNNT